ncbi:hypothetical protein OHV05_04390 [Kitasatospora sp. NBC_00070]|uniref:hypothetical protein n=1 Tax=Kitasatospora sp. NBC_00070 TaxID=2975962 RepID=UPI003250C3C0
MTANAIETVPYLTVMDAITAGYTVGTWGKGTTPHALLQSNETSTLCNKRDAVKLDKADPEAKLCRTCGGWVTKAIAEKAADADETITPAGDAIETTQERDAAEAEVKAKAEADAKALDTVDYTAIYGMEAEWKGAVSKVATALKATSKANAVMAGAMLMLRTMVVRDGLPTLDGAANPYQTAVTDLLNEASAKAGMEGAAGNSERTSLKRGAQHLLADRLLTEYVRALDAKDSGEAWKFNLLVDRHHAVTGPALEAAKEAYEAAKATGTKEEAKAARQALEAAKTEHNQPVSELVFRAFPTVSRMTGAELRAAKKEPKPVAAKAAPVAEEPEEKTEAAPAPAPAPEETGPVALLKAMRKALARLDAELLLNLSPEDRQALLDEMDQLEGATASVRTTLVP